MAVQGLEQELFPRLAALEDAPAKEQAAAREDLLRHLQAGGRHFAAHGYILGREYTLLDCGWAALLHQMQRLGMELPASAEPLRRYAARLAARPATQRCYNPESSRKHR
jgi:RNA polymerase-associated protein